MFQHPWPSSIKALTAAGAIAWLAACSGTPPAEPASQPVAAAPAAPDAATAAPTAPAAAQADTINGKPLSPDRILALQHAGYTFIDKNGQTYACRKETKTGSRLARETVCMTPQQADALREETQRRLGDMMRTVPPPQGT